MSFAKHDHAQHPAAYALEQALVSCDGTFDKSRVHVAACIYNAPLRLSDTGSLIQHAWYGHQAKQPLYPASVVKLFVLDALAGFREQDLLQECAEDDRAATQMMGISSNEATVYLVGRLTGAEDGAPLPGPELEEWCAARQRVQNWYDAQKREEFVGINILHGTYHDSPYGRAKQIRTNDNGNKLTALAAAALMHDIVRGARPRAEWMLELMDRSFQRGVPDLDPDGDQVRGFLSDGLPDDVHIWSKAGHTSWTRHDLVYAELRDGRSFILCVMCDGEDFATDKSFLPSFARIFYQHAFGDA